MSGYPGSNLKSRAATTVVTVSNSAQSSHAFGKITKSFTVQCNEFEIIRYSWVADEVVSGTHYGILYPRESYSEDNLMLSYGILYLHAPGAASTVEVVIHEWA